MEAALTPIDAPPLAWAGFIALVLGVLALDLGVLRRETREVTAKEAALWSVFWVATAGLFALGLHHFWGPERAMEFAAGYLIEKSLSLDNVFVFVLLFGAFAIPAREQHRVLFWGILGALVMRAAFILAGSALLSRFHGILYVFGALLLLAGLKMLWPAGKQGGEEPEGLPAPVRWLQRVLPVAPGPEGSFLVRVGGRLHATPLLLTLLAVEACDLFFAVDSIPAVFAVTTDPFVVFTSNVFALLGLRSLYFLLAAIVPRLRFLKAGLALLLVLVGLKLLLAPVLHITTGLSLAGVALVLAGAVGLSLLFPSEAVAASAPRQAEP
jgi:tellurite resistance protein TerC